MIQKVIDEAGGIALVVVGLVGLWAVYHFPEKWPMK